MEYKVIYTLGHSVDEEYDMKGYRSDIILKDEENNYYELNFVEPDVIKNGFDANSSCYIDTNLIVIRDMGLNTILKSIESLHKWQFNKYWKPLTFDLIEKHYYPKEKWIFYSIQID
jgi:hypothetical protein